MPDITKMDYFNQPHLEQLVADILREAVQQGATSAEVDVAVNKGFTVTARKGEVETVEYNQDKIIELTVYFGKRCGTASLSDVRPEAIRSAVQAACNIARFTDEDEFNALADKKLLAFDYPSVDIYSPWSLSVPQAIEMVLECEAMALSKDKRIVNSEGATLSTGEVWHSYGNTQGFIGTCPVTRHEISCVLIAKKGKEMQRDYCYSVACDPSMLESIQHVAETAVERTVRRLGAQRLSTCKVPVIYAAEEARGLLGHFVSAIQGSSLYRKSSFLLDHLGQRVFPDHVQIDERPYLAKYLGSAPFDDDGVATRPNVFIDKGILKSYAMGIYSAKKLGMETTGNGGGVHNLFISTGDKDLPALMKKMGKGILVTELMGNGVNLVTGDYSRGMSGFWVENGEIQYPVEEITLAGRLQDMYGNLVEVANDVDTRGNIQTGSILLEEMTIAGE
ncbi:MAG: metalloprotease PmbA [Gammaproteobacteria bacterium]|nr:metalloprotease PmbA [Gammaproteobacteria bacterium]